MRVLFDENGYLKSWALDETAGRLSDDDQIIETPQIDDIKQFYKESHLYHLVDGKLVKDKNRQAQLDAEKAQEKKVLSLQEKIALFIEAFDVDEQPDCKQGFKHRPYFDKDKMKFAWKSIADDKHGA